MTVKSALIPRDLTMMEAGDGSFAERITREASIRNDPRELRAVFCPDCRRHYTVRPGLGRGWPCSVPHIRCTGCGEKASAAPTGGTKSATRDGDRGL